jgi:excisionase family DNA binding protein
VIVKPGEPLLTFVEAKDYLKVSERTLARLTASGDLAVVRVGAQLRYPVNALADYCNRNVRGGVA